MRLGFYYHIALHQKQGVLFAPSYLGVFIDELALKVEELLIVYHEANGNEIVEADYQLNAKNIKAVSLGNKTAAWHRSLFGSKIINNSLQIMESCDAFIVRSPSPLAAILRERLKKPTVFFMVVGDYGVGAKELRKKGIKNFLLKNYFNHVDKKFKAEFATTDIFVNSPQLMEMYAGKGKSLHLIKTTTLRSEDLFKRTNFELHKPIEILYTGRIEVSKGLNELVESIAILDSKSVAVHLNIVGWESKPGHIYENRLKEFAIKLGIDDKITFHGKKSIGDELNEMYRNADIYVIPSYHEGFPRTIWEAMANSIPVIATKVGGIPFYLTSNVNAILIEPKNSSDIASAVIKVTNDEDLRLNLIANGYNLAQEVTLENQTSLMLEIIKTKLNQ